MVRFWKVSDGEEVLAMMRPAIVFSVRFSPDDKVAVTTAGNVIDMWTVDMQPAKNAK